MDFIGKNKKPGFTLLEVLIVTAIIALIASFVVVNITSTKQKSRDVRREQDIKQIQNALNIYATNKGLYPACGGGGDYIIIDGTSDCLSSALIGNGSIDKLPTDPLRGSNGSCDNAGDYVYCYLSNGSAYIIHYALEGNTIPGKSPGWQAVKS